MITFGYACVSALDRNLSDQVELLKEAGATAILTDKISGPNAARPELVKLMKVIGRGDLVLVTRVDRLGGCSTRELLELIQRIENRGAGFKSLGEPLFDTTTGTGRLLAALLPEINRLDRDLIRSRRSEGRDRARAKGVKLGRKPALTEHQVQEVLARLANGDSHRAIARMFNVDRSTISKLLSRKSDAAASVLQSVDDGTTTGPEADAPEPDHPASGPARHSPKTLLMQQIDGERDGKGRKIPKAVRQGRTISRAELKRIKNGRELFFSKYRCDDGRRPARAYYEMIRALHKMMGGEHELDVMELSVAEAFAGAAIATDWFNGKLINGEITPEMARDQTERFKLILRTYSIFSRPRSRYRSRRMEREEPFNLDKLLAEHMAARDK